METKPVLIALGIALSSAAVLSAQAFASTFTIDNSTTVNTTVQPFGAPDSATFGQTFTTDSLNTLLDDFSLFVGGRFRGDESLELRGYLATWTGTNAGSILYASATQSTNGNQQFTFVPNLTLLPNTSYVAFLSISELPPQLMSGFFMPSSFMAYGNPNSVAPGDFVYLNSGTDFSQLTSSAWHIYAPSFSDLQFIANFSQATSVPEPGTLAILGLGLAGLAAMRRRRH